MKTKTILITLIALLAITAFIFQSCGKDDEEKANTPPTCKISSPTNGQEIAKGETITISVEATDSDGSITEVRFFVNNVGMGSATSFPYNYIWDSSNESIGTHSIKATSIDNEGGSASDEITVTIIESGGSTNTPPTATFNVSPTSGTTSTNFTFDASGCTDNEDPTSNLQVRWDFDGNGSWDTGWDTDKMANHQYSSEATYTAKLEVKDTEGLTDQYTKSITVNNGGGGTGSFTDPRDGQTYQTVDIGAQTWMAENLNYETADSWEYDNSSANGAVYGRLYNWDAAMNGEASSNTVPSGVQGVCPPGWHLPSDDEWKVLEMALGMSQSEADDTGWRGTDEGGKMKEAGTSHWDSPNTGATNSSGFTALPGGYRYSNGSFNYLGDLGFWWSSSEYSGTHAWYRILNYATGQVLRDSNHKAYGFSVRCLKD